MDTQVIRYSLPSTPMASFTTLCPAASTGIRAGSRTGLPILTRTLVTSPLAPCSPDFLSTVRSRYFIFPALTTLICSASVSPLSYTYFATQRMPFPHISAREPSPLYISISKSASLDGLINITPSPPIPKCLSLSRLTRSGFSRTSVFSSKPFT